MTWIVDASVAVKWYFQETDSIEAKALAVAGDKLIAPELLMAEILNVFWRLDRKGGAHSVDRSSSLESLKAVIDEWFPLNDLAKRAGEISESLDHPVYDCFYLALAEKEQATLVTADTRLLGRLNGTPFQNLATSLAQWAHAT